MKKLLMVAVLSASFMSLIEAKKVTFDYPYSKQLVYGLKGIINFETGAPITFMIRPGNRLAFDYADDDSIRDVVFTRDFYEDNPRGFGLVKMGQGEEDVTIEACVNSGGELNISREATPKGTLPINALEIGLRCIPVKMKVEAEEFKEAREGKRGEEFRRDLRIDTRPPAAAATMAPMSPPRAAEIAPRSPVRYAAAAPASPRLPAEEAPGTPLSWAPYEEEEEDDE